MNRDKILNYMKYDTKVINTIRTLKFYVTIMGIAIIIYKFVLGVEKGTGSYDIALTVMGIYLVLTLLSLGKMFINIFMINIKVSKLDLKYSFNEEVGYMLEEEDYLKLNDNQIKYIEDINKLSRERIKDLKVRVGLNKGVLTESEAITAGNILSNFDADIKEIERISKDSIGLKRVLIKEDRILGVKEFLGSLVYEPKRVIEVPDVINKYMPHLVVLVKQYIKVENHTLKDDYTTKVLEETEDVIVGIVDLIDKDYRKFKNKELGDLKMTIKAINQMRDKEEENLTGMF